MDELDLRHITMVRASMGATVGMLASQMRPVRFDALVFIGPSPRYLNERVNFGGVAYAEMDAFEELVASGSIAQLQGGVG